MSVFGHSTAYRQRRGLPMGRLVIAAIIAGVSLLAYFGRTAINPVTGEKQRIALSVNQEIALGLESAPEMARQFGGLDPDPRRQQLVKSVGQRIVSAIPKAADVYPFDFHLLGDSQTVNAFALPGGQVFITRALFDQLKTEGQLAGVLGHEVGHVVQRHSAEHIAKAQLQQGLTGAVAVGAYDPDRPGSSRNVAIAAAVAAQLASLKYSRNDELESDRVGLKYMADAGYDPRSMIEVMRVLQAASGGGRTPEFFATHPNPENRLEKLQALIREIYPQGVPGGLKE
jgi:beta-barrel assembly-enhancing protease